MIGEAGVERHREAHRMNCVIMLRTTIHRLCRMSVVGASRPFIGPILKGRNGSTLPVGRAVGERPYLRIPSIQGSKPKVSKGSKAALSSTSRSTQEGVLQPCADRPASRFRCCVWAE